MLQEGCDWVLTHFLKCDIISLNFCRVTGSFPPCFNTGRDPLGVQNGLFATLVLMGTPQKAA